MRLLEVFHRCKEAWMHLDLSGSGRYEIVNTKYLPQSNKLSASFSLLEPIDFFKDDIAALKGLYNYAAKSSNDYATSFSREKSAEETYKDAFLQKYTQFQEKILTILALFDFIGYDGAISRTENELGFDVKLPPNLSLTELSKCAKDINTILTTCPLLISKEATITFSTVDVGSVWLNFMVAGVAVTAILNGVAALVDKALIIRSHNLTTKEQIEKIRKLQLGNEIIETTKLINDEIGKGLLNKVSTDLANANGISDPEDVARLKNSIQLLSEWMTKGMEVYAAIHAPSDIKAIFPPIESQALPEGVVKMITDGSGTNDE